MLTEDQQRIADADKEVQRLERKFQLEHDLALLSEERYDIAKKEARLLQARVAQLEAMLEGTSEDYVAWLRYVHHGDTPHIQLCDSDADGAFKVYRRRVNG